MRDTNRTLQLKLRDIEVANDDYERQARNTTSSLDDLESKFNVSIERGVMLEEEIRSGEQERESLRVETQRLREELSDLKVETEITAEKLHLAEATIERLHTRKPAPLHVRPARPRSSVSEDTRTTTSSPTVSTPPPSKSGASSEVPTPPSPPLSDASANPKAVSRAPAITKRRSFLPDAPNTPRSSLFAPSRTPRHSRGPSVTSASISVTSNTHRMGPPPPRPASTAPPESLARSGSLVQIKGLIGRMQKIEERVHSVRSKLPPPSNTTPKKSPRAGSVLGDQMPSTVTMRSGRKRMSTATFAKPDDETPDGRSTTNRLSFGMAPTNLSNRPATSTSRPSSRASNTSHSEAANPFARPASRSSMGGARTPLGHYANPTVSTAERRPRSSIGGNYGQMHKSRHVHSSSMSESREADAMLTPTARRTTLDKTGIPTPFSASKRQSGGAMLGRRPSLGFGQVQNEFEVPPPLPSDRRRKLSGVGETF